MNQLNNLFSTTSNQNTENNSPIQNSQLIIQQGETYHQYGVRTCGVVQGSEYSLPPYLQKIYFSMKTAQINDEVLQAQHRSQKQSNIDNKAIQKQGLIRQRYRIRSSIEEARDSIKEKNKAINELNNSVEVKSNKDEKLKRNIGIIILILLTLYLFVFYSSTFYSAFFRNPETITDVMNAMLDAKALSIAANAGITELLFCILAPIIFLGLGFILHVFSKEKGVGKYIKMSLIVIVTLMFDMILSYKIGDQLHQMSVITGSAPIGEQYYISMAVKDINCWAVIFLGFISYIIWGLLFDMTMDAHQKIDERTTQKKSLQKQIAYLQANIRSDQARESVIDGNIIDIDVQISNLKATLTDYVITYSNIKTELNNFFTGWLAQLSLLGKSNDDKQRAQALFDSTVSGLIPN